MFVDGVPTILLCYVFSPPSYLLCLHEAMRHEQTGSHRVFLATTLARWEPFFWIKPTAFTWRGGIPYWLGSCSSYSCLLLLGLVKSLCT